MVVLEKKAHEDGSASLLYFKGFPLEEAWRLI